MLNSFRSHLSFANVVSLVALSVALGGTTYAATGGNFILGQSNTATSTTALSAGTTGPAFKATNTSTGAAASFNAVAGHPAVAVNTAAKVTKLNADLLDGHDSTDWKMTELMSALPGDQPLQATYTSSGGKLLIMASGSAYRRVTGGPMSVALKVDGVQRLGMAGFTNEPVSHKALVAAYGVVSGRAAGAHTIELVPFNGSTCGTGSESTATICTTVDASDYFSMSVIEMP